MQNTEKTNLHQAVAAAIDAVNSSNTAGVILPSNYLSVKTGDAEPRVVIGINGDRVGDIKTARKVLGFWGEQIDSRFEGDFIMQIFVENYFYPVEASYIK